LAQLTTLQALRNSLMSATVVATTAALALMASLTLGGASLASGLAERLVAAPVPDGGADRGRHRVSARKVLRAVVLRAAGR
jgi:hypothetical protein